MENNLVSLILDTDSYKFSHWVQYPPKTEFVFSYLESRGGSYESTVFFGLQYFLKKYLSKPITMEEVEEAEFFTKLHGVPCNKEGWEYIINKHKGYLPVKISAVPEGSIIPTGNILMSVENTDPKVPWLVNYLETALLRIWYPIMVCTRSYFCKKLINKFIQYSSDDPNEWSFKLHDFGSRGASSQETAMIGGAAHLVNFLGSDTVPGIYMASKYYNIEMPGFSIPASEHSTMTMWGRVNEHKAYENMLEQYKNQPIFACVSDSYDIYNAVKNLWGDELKSKVENYQGTLVIRPDSGNPTEVILKLLNILDEIFGSTKNSKGYKVINNNVRLIQGDGINEESLEDICKTIISNGFSITNISFGMGGGLLQDLNRDTCKFAFKCSAAVVDGKAVEVYKDPVTDAGKRSKRGRIKLIEKSKNRVLTVPESEEGKSLLIPYYENGKIFVDQTFQEIRERTDKEYKQSIIWQDKEV